MNSDTMEPTHNIEIPQPNDFPRLLEIWEASVRATHGFVTEENIQTLKNLIVEKEIFQHTNLICVRNESGRIEGFAGTTGANLDMLFVSPASFKSGVGKALIKHAIEVSGAWKVDVNEQNDNARSFYEHFGFTVIERSELDDYGQPFPVLHMQMKK